MYTSKLDSFRLDKQIMSTIHLREFLFTKVLTNVNLVSTLNPNGTAKLRKRYKVELKKRLYALLSVGNLPENPNSLPRVSGV